MPPNLDVNFIFDSHAARPKFYQATYADPLMISTVPAEVEQVVDYADALRLFKTALSGRPKRARMQWTYRLEKFDSSINLGKIIVDSAILKNYVELEHSVFKQIEEYVDATIGYLRQSRYEELDTLNTISLVLGDRYCELAVSDDGYVDAVDPAGTSVGRLFSPLCFLQLPQITVCPLMRERFIFDPIYNTVLLLLTTASLAYFLNLKSMIKSPYRKIDFIRYMTSLQGSGKSMELYTASCLLRRVGLPVIFFNNWAGMTTVTKFAPVLILEMFGMFCSVKCEDGKQYIRQFIRDYGHLLDGIEDPRGNSFRVMTLLIQFVYYCSEVLHDATACRLCIIIDQMNTPFGYKDADDSIFEFFRLLLNNELLVQVYVSSTNNDVDRRYEFFKHTTMQLMPKLSKLPHKELLLLAHAFSIGLANWDAIFECRKGSFVITKIDDGGLLSWRDRKTRDFVFFYAGDIPYYLVRFCRSFGSDLEAKSMSFRKRLPHLGTIASYWKSEREKTSLLRNMLRIFLGLSGRSLVSSDLYDRRYIYEESVLGESAVIYRFVSQFIYEEFQKVYRADLEELIYSLLGFPTPTMVENDIDKSAKGSIIETYLISILSSNRDLMLPSAFKDGSFFALPNLKLMRQRTFDLSHSDLNSKSDFIIRPPAGHPIHDAYILIQSVTSMNSFRSFIKPSVEQAERSGVLFGLQITVGDTKSHYRNDHEISMETNPRKYQVISDIAKFVQERNLNYAEIYISPKDPQHGRINWWPIRDL